MINRYVIANLRHRVMRTLLSALVVGVQVMLILTLIGLSRGMLNDAAARAKGTGADIFIKPGSTFSFASAQMNEKYVDFIRKQPNVKQAGGVLMIGVETILSLNGVDIPTFRQIAGPGFHFVEGGVPTDPDGIIVDEYYARQHKLHVGQTVTFLNHPWHVTGIIQGGVLARLIVDKSRLQDLTGNVGRINQILVKVDDASKTNDTVKYLNDKLEGRATAISAADFASMFSTTNFPALQYFIWVVVVLAVFVGFLVVFLSMYTAVIERTREIGILKALGAGPGTIVGILVRESLLLAVVGTILGIVLSFGAKALIMHLVPASLQVETVPPWWGYSALIAMSGALLGAIYPGMKAAKQDAIEALAYD